MKEKQYPWAGSAGSLVVHLCNWELRCAWTWPDFEGMQVSTVAGVSQRTSWRSTGTALPMSAWLHPLYPPLHRMAMSRLQMWSATRPRHCLGVSEPKQQRGQWGTVNWSDGGSVLRPAPRSCFTDQCRHTLILTHPVILLPIFLSSTVRHSVKHPYPEEWGFFSLPPPQQSPQPAKSWQTCQNTRSDRYPSRCRSCMNNTSLHSLGVWMPPTPVFPLMPCCSTAARRSSFILPGIWKEVHLQWLLEQENYLIPPVCLRLLQGITGEHKTSVHLCLSKPFLGYAARGRSSHMYKIPCRIWWKLRERTVMVFRWRFGSWSRTGGWGRTDAMGFKAKAASMSCLLLSQVMQISWHYRAADCCMCII